MLLDVCVWRCIKLVASLSHKDMAMVCTAIESQSWPLSLETDKLQFYNRK